MVRTMATRQSEGLLSSFVLFACNTELLLLASSLLQEAIFDSWEDGEGRAVFQTAHPFLVHIIVVDHDNLATQPEFTSRRHF